MHVTGLKCTVTCLLVHHAATGIKLHCVRRSFAKSSSCTIVYDVLVVRVWGVVTDYDGGRSCFIFNSLKLYSEGGKVA